MSKTLLNCTKLNRTFEMKLVRFSFNGFSFCCVLFECFTVFLFFFFDCQIFFVIAAVLFALCAGQRYPQPYTSYRDVPIIKLNYNLNPDGSYQYE